MGEHGVRREGCWIEEGREDSRMERGREGGRKGKRGGREAGRGRAWREKGGVLDRGGEGG